MQPIITKSVIDTLIRFPQLWEMLTHDEILTEMIRQIDVKILRQTDVAMKLSIAPARVAEMRTGKRRIQPSEMPALATLLGMSSDRATSEIRNVIRSPEIPILGKVAQGLWLEQTLSDPEDLEFIPYDRLPGDPDELDLFAVIPEGASMNLEFPVGVILICKRLAFSSGDIELGDLVIVEREAHDMREMTCKILGRSDEGEYLLLSNSDRPEFQEPINIGQPSNDHFLDNGINIIGKVERGVLDYRRRRKH